MHGVDLGESFQTHIFLQNFVSMQPRRPGAPQLCVKSRKSSDGAVSAGLLWRKEVLAGDGEEARAQAPEEAIVRISHEIAHGKCCQIIKTGKRFFFFFYSVFYETIV